MKKEIPILFSTPMVQAIIEDRKTKTRRTKGLEFINEASDNFSHEYKGFDGEFHLMKNNYGATNAIKCPYGNPGDVLWIREAFNIEQYPKPPEGDTDELLFYYRATERKFTDMKWKPSIHMPKSAARIWLEVINVRIERLQDITDEDAKKEGVEKLGSILSWTYRNYLSKSDTYECQYSAKESFSTLWQSINGDESWSNNPWVWVITFKLLSKTGRPSFLDAPVKTINVQRKFERMFPKAKHHGSY